MCYPAEFGRSRSNGTSFFKEIRLKNLTTVSHLSRSLKVVGTDTYRSATYDFLLTFHNNHGPISYRFRDRRRFQSKISKKNSTSLYFVPPLKEFSLELGTGAGDQKTRVMGLSDRERSLTITSAQGLYRNLTGFP